MDREQTDVEKAEVRNTETETEVTTGGAKLSSGLDENIAGVLCYIVGAVSGIIFLIIEKENRFVRFHALQSIIAFVVILVLNIALSVIPFVGWIISLLMAPLILILWIFLMYKAYQGQMFKLPIVGNIAEKQVDQLKF